MSGCVSCVWGFEHKESYVINGSNSEGKQRQNWFPISLHLLSQQLSSTASWMCATHHSPTSGSEAAGEALSSKALFTKQESFSQTSPWWHVWGSRRGWPRASAPRQEPQKKLLAPGFNHSGHLGSKPKDGRLFCASHSESITLPLK